MRLFFLILLVLGVAVGVGLATRFDVGYVLVAAPPWRLEMSLPLALASLLLLFLAAYLLVRLLRRALLLPADMRQWRAKRRKEQADEELTRAIAALLSGQPAHARKLADKALGRQPSPLASLVACHAALAVDDRAGARLYLTRWEKPAQDNDQGELTAARQHLEGLLPPLPESGSALAAQATHAVQ